LVLQLVKAPLQLRQARSVVAVVASLAAPMARAIKIRASAQRPLAQPRLLPQAQALFPKPSPVAALISQRLQAQALCLKPSLVAALISQRPQAQAL